MKKRRIDRCRPANKAEPDALQLTGTQLPCIAADWRISAMCQVVIGQQILHECLSRCNMTVCQTTLLAAPGSALLHTGLGIGTEVVPVRFQSGYSQVQQPWAREVTLT